MKKKFASLLLVMALVFTMIPAMAFAATAKSISVAASDTKTAITVTATSDAEDAGFGIYEGTFAAETDVQKGGYYREGGENGYVKDFEKGQAYTWGYLSAGTYTAALFTDDSDYVADAVYTFTVKEAGQPVATIKTDKDTYAFGDAIKVTTDFMNIDAWVGLYKKGEDPANAKSIIWYMIPAANQQVTMTDKAWLDSPESGLSDEGDKYGNRPEEWIGDNLKCGDYQVVVAKDYGGSAFLATKEFSISHAWNAGTVTTAASCKAEGVKTFTCTRCNTTKTEAVAKAAHKEETIPAKTATCTATGLTEGKQCTVCKEVTVAQKPVAKVAHKEVVVPAVAATCTASGLTEGKKCSECGEVTVAQTPVSVKPHNKVEIPAVAATCTATGLTAGEKCADCGAITTAQTEVAATGHTPATTTVKATTTKDGKATTACTACGESLSTTVIKKASKITLSKATAVYTGKNIKAPTVLVKDSAGKTIAASNYTITKPANVNKMKAIGRYTFTVKFKGDKYSGTKKVYFEITAKKPTIKAPAAAKKAVTVKWAKGKKDQVTGYEVQASTSKKFTTGVKKATVKGYAKTSGQIKNLKAKKTYYVKVRSYKTVKGVKVYSPWSATKTVKTK